MKTVYERIREVRLERGMTLEELAHKVGYNSRGAMSKIERGERRITVDLLKRIAAALNVEPDYLVMGSDRESIQEEINRLFDSLNPEQQEAVLQFLRSMTAGR